MTAREEHNIRGGKDVQIQSDQPNCQGVCKDLKQSDGVTMGTDLNCNDVKKRNDSRFPSIVEIKKTIPPHCFRSSLFLSLYYAIRDVVVVALLFAAAVHMWDVLPAYAAATLTPLYWLLQGTFFWAIFVSGHDCGHDSFSNSIVLNNVVGTILHTFVMTPYYCWKLSHRNHHKNTGNIDRDEVFYPVREHEATGKQILPYFYFGTGWLIYLIYGFNPRPVCHFNPWDELFKRHVFHCAFSIACVAVWAVVLFYLAVEYGVTNLVYHYAVPWFIGATYLVIVTFLHHAEEDVPWFADSEWENVKGRISSVDRHYGWCHEITHNIGTHQIHHLFPKIPHYHMEEATRHFRKNYPELVYACDEPIMQSFIRMFKLFAKQHIIGSDVTIHIYKKSV